jgi:hypothetical protein
MNTVPLGKEMEEGTQALRTIQLGLLYSDCHCQSLICVTNGLGLGRVSIGETTVLRR